MLQADYTRSIDTYGFVKRLYPANSLQLIMQPTNINVSATDIFNTSNSDWTMNTYGVFVNKRQSIDNRGITLSATYRFNPKKSKYIGQNASDSEMERL